MAGRFRQRVREDFATHDALYWGNLARLNNLVVVLNVSLFFVTELVTSHGYYYTFFSLLRTAVVYVGLLLPLGFVRSLPYYLFFAAMEAIAIYFVVVSAWYWVVTNRVG